MTSCSRSTTCGVEALNELARSITQKEKGKTSLQIWSLGEKEATAREAAQAEASRNAPAPTPQLRTRDEQMSFLVGTIQGMEKKISEIFLNYKSLERIVETKFHDLDVKVTELTTIVEHL
ncbi:hypothetical protein D1007_45268 [Hordeum vulgare]|nr:hypothetical protein D1007_45268 [Hordeum vulgare]